MKKFNKKEKELNKKIIKFEFQLSEKIEEIQQIRNDLYERITTLENLTKELFSENNILINKLAKYELVDKFSDEDETVFDYTSIKGKLVVIYKNYKENITVRLSELKIVMEMIEYIRSHNDEVHSSERYEKIIETRKKIHEIKTNIISISVKMRDDLSRF